MTHPFTILERFANWFVKRDLSIASIVDRNYPASPSSRSG